MNFISVAFVLFFIVAVAIYVCIPDRHKWKALLIFSVFFYACSGLEKLVFILGTSVVVYWVSCKMEAAYQEVEKTCQRPKLSVGRKQEIQNECKKKNKRLLVCALFLCIGILAYCKYASRFFEMIAPYTGFDGAWKIIVPLGVSYYTFSSVGYLLDVYWKKIRPTHDYLKLLLCMIYFPHIVQGPISRYQLLLPQFETLTRPSYERFCLGLQLMLWGYLKKMVIADRLGIFVNNVFGNVGANEGITFLVALVFGAFQVYADFSGCMDIVCGASSIFGIQLEQNFNHPFFSKSAAEFWRRWHITLGNWFKDYIFFPVTTSTALRNLRRKIGKRFGANAGKVVVTLIPLGVVWLLTGIWHGTGMNYVIWGIYWGCLIAYSTLFAKQNKSLLEKLKIRTDSFCWQGFQMFRTFWIYAGGLILVLPDSLKTAILAIKRMFSTCNLWIFWDQSLYAHGLDKANFTVAILMIVLLVCVDAIQEWGKVNIRETIGKQNLVFRWAIFYAGIVVILLLGIYGPGYDAQAFIYEQF